MEEKIIKLLKKHKKKILLYIVAVFVICLFVVQLPYWIGDIKTIVYTDFAPEDILSFLGDFLAALGTVILGWIAIKQTDYANKISDRLLGLEEKRYNDEHTPKIVVDWVKLHDSSYRNKVLKVGYEGRVYYVDSPNYDPNSKDGFWEIRIINTGVTGIYNCTVKKITSVPDELRTFGIGVDSWDAPFNLKCGECIDLNLYMNPDIVERYAQNKVKSINIILEAINNFGEKYQLVLSVTGNIVAYDNRYEQMLTPTVHPIKWDLKCELIDKV